MDDMEFLASAKYNDLILRHDIERALLKLTKGAPYLPLKTLVHYLLRTGTSSSFHLPIYTNTFEYSIGTVFKLSLDEISAFSSVCLSHQRSRENPDEIPVDFIIQL